MFASSAHSQDASVIESKFSFQILFPDLFKQTDPNYVAGNPILQAKQQQQQRQIAQTDATKTIRPLTQNKKNPFAKKTQDSPAGTPPSARGVAIFDEIKPSPIFKSKGAPGNAKENQQTTKPKNTKQSTLFSMKKSVASATTSEESTPTGSATPSSEGSTSQKTGFMLWLEQNQSILQEEHPEASDSELTRLAAQRFRALPEAERQVSVFLSLHVHFDNGRSICYAEVQPEAQGFGGRNRFARW
jgi:HMG (high mobility group) box